MGKEAYNKAMKAEQKHMKAMGVGERRILSKAGKPRTRVVDRPRDNPKLVERRRGGD